MATVPISKSMPLPDEGLSKQGVFKIESGIPLPSPRRARLGGKWGTLPFAKLEVGQSFLVPAKDMEQKKKTRDSLSSTCATQGKKLDRRFVTRIMDDGIRVWRVEKDVPEAAE